MERHHRPPDSPTADDAQESGVIHEPSTSSSVLPPTGAETRKDSPSEFQVAEHMRLYGVSGETALRDLTASYSAAPSSSVQHQSIQGLSMLNPQNLAHPHQSNVQPVPQLTLAAIRPAPVQLYPNLTADEQESSTTPFPPQQQHYVSKAPDTADGPTPPHAQNPTQAAPPSTSLPQFQRPPKPVTTKKSLKHLVHDVRDLSTAITSSAPQRTQVRKRVQYEYFS